MSKLTKVVNGATCLLISIVTTVSAAPSSCEQKQDDGSFKLVSRIVNGHNIEITDAPWQVALLDSNGFQFCGGSFLSPTWVLTAAHCITKSSPSSYTVGYGKTNKQNLKKVPVKRVFKHPKYIEATQGYDIALLQLTSSVNTDDKAVQKVSLASDKLERVLLEEQKCASVTGWGTTRYQGGASATLQRAAVAFVGKDECESAYRKKDASFRLAADQICAGGDGVYDSCQGDSGGPLMVSDPNFGDIQVGVVSWGYGCAVKNFPGLYTDINFHMKWINSVYAKYKDL